MDITGLPPLRLAESPTKRWLLAPGVVLLRR
jgi:hypothetical protein